MSLKRHFKFSYQTDLDIATCDKRLSDDYYFRMIKLGVFRAMKKSWQLNIYRTKKGVIRASMIRGGFFLYFRISLVEEGERTIISIAYSPLTLICPSGLLLGGLMAASFAIAILSPIMAEPRLIGLSIGVFLIYVLPFGLMSVITDNSARKILKDYLEKALVATPADGATTR
jgi:hypothetical protein